MNVEEMVARAKAAYRADRKAEARTLLLEAVQQDPNHEDAWLWLSGLVETLEDQQLCLENVLALNPMHARARQGLEAVERKIAEQAAQPPAPAPDPEPADDWGAPATSVEWGRDDGPAAYGSGKQVDLPTHDEYDAWVSELHLESSAGNAASSSAPPFIMDALGPFGDTTYMHDSTPFLGDSPLMAVRSQPEPDDAWPSISRSAPAELARVWPAPAPEAPPATPTPRPARNEFSFDDDEEPAPPPAPPPVAPPFSAAAPAAPRTPGPAPAKAAPPQTAQPPASEQDRYFAYIPAEVTPDRARRRSRTLNLALVVLLLANIAAAVALVSAL